MQLDAHHFDVRKRVTHAGGAGAVGMKLLTPLLA
jgi:hypothetical protein